MNTKETPPIMLRANITPEEWAAFRKLAIDVRMTNAELVGEALREFLRQREA